MDEEVIAGKCVQPERTGGLGSPLFQIRYRRFMIIQSTKNCDGAIEWTPRRISVGVAKFEIRSHEWNHEPKQLRLFEHFFRRAVETADLIDKLRLGEIMQYRGARA